MVSEGRTTEMVAGARRAGNRQQPFGLDPLRRVGRIADHASPESEQSGDASQEDRVHIGQPRLSVRAFVPGLHRGRELLKERRSLVGQFDLAPMLVRPRLFDFDLIYRMYQADT